MTPMLQSSPNVGAKDYISMISENDIVTKNEIKGICERLGVAPSQRQRIIIARSQDPANVHGPSGSINPLGGAETDRQGSSYRPKIGSMDQNALESLNRTHHFKNDSKMSI